MQNVTDLASYVDFLKNTRIGQLKYADQLYQDSVLLILTNNREDFSDAIDILIASTLDMFENNPFDPNFIESKNNILLSINNDLVAARDKVFADPTLLKKVESEINIRKAKNIKQLKVYGLIS